MNYMKCLLMLDATSGEMKRASGVSSRSDIFVYLTARCHSHHQTHKCNA
jgi:hypothetical protein